MAIKSVFEQTTILTCLPACLITLLREQKGLDVPDSEEMEILVNGIRFTKMDYATGQLAYISNKYNVKIEHFVEFQGFCRKLSGLKIPRSHTIICKKIDRRFLSDICRYSPVIVYLDDFYLHGIVHIPHFVILESMNEERAVIHDPWDGKRKEISVPNLMQAVGKLRNLLKYSPVVVRIL